MAYVPVPKDLSKIKTKLAFNLTKRQLVCFSSAAAVGLPAYLFSRGSIGNSAAMFLMIGLMLPFFFLAMYERDGLPLEKVLKNIIRTRFLYPVCGLTKPKTSMRCLAPERRRSRLRNSRRAGKPAGKKPEKQGLLGLFTKGKNIPTTAQQTLSYREMYRDGVCRVADRYYTKTIEYEDINYQLAQSEDQAAIFDGWSACLNYFDSSLPFQLSFLNHRSRPGSRYSVNIPMQDDDYNSVRCEYVEMLENQIAKSNNGIVRTKLLTFGVNVDDLSTARARLERVEADICGNFKKLGVKCRSLSGLERLELLHGQLHPGSGSPFRFSWDMIPKTGLSTKDFIAPDSFDFRFSRLFRVGTTWGAASYLQILASELSDKLLAELLEMDAEMTITLHIQTVDQAAAVKSIKAKVSDIDKMKVEEQKKAARSGYDMDILPPDLVTYSNDAKTLLEDLQSRNERMFLLTFLVVNMAPTRRELDNDLFTVSGIVQKYNCTLKRLDFQQEDGFLSSLPLGHNGIEIKRGMTTSSTAIFVPFMTQELRMDGEASITGSTLFPITSSWQTGKSSKTPTACSSACRLR